MVAAFGWRATAVLVGTLAGFVILISSFFVLSIFFLFVERKCANELITRIHMKSSCHLLPHFYNRR